MMARGGDAPGGHGCTGSFQQVLCTEPPIVMLESWDDVYKTLSVFSEQELAERRARLATWSEQWWRRVATCLRLCRKCDRVEKCTTVQ